MAFQGLTVAKPQFLQPASGLSGVLEKLQGKIEPRHSLLLLMI